MAYPIGRIDPRDLQPRKAIGVGLPFSGPAVFNQTFQTKEAIKANLINFMLTNPGERVYNPDLGLGLRGFLFSNITQSSVSNLKTLASDKIKLYFPRIIINRLEIVAEPDRNTLELYLRYSIRDTNIVDEEINIQVEQ